MNGSGVDHEARLQTEIAQMERAYAVLQARDGSAERRAHLWQVMAFILAIAMVGIGVWDHLAPRERVRAMVQTVQVLDDGTVANLGVPQDVMAYEPQEGHWKQMLYQWVQYRRWRSGEPVVTQRDWAWVYAHTCGEARTFLKREEDQEKPFDPKQKAQVQVWIESVTKSPAPLNYQVLWRERMVDPLAGSRDTSYSGTFVVKRYTPPTQEAMMQNRLWLCVAAYDITPRP